MKGRFFIEQYAYILDHEYEPVRLLVRLRNCSWDTPGEHLGGTKANYIWQGINERAQLRQRAVCNRSTCSPLCRIMCYYHDLYGADHGLGG